MATPSEIKNKARSINSNNQDISLGRDRCKDYVNNSQTWWKADAGKVFRNQYNEIHNEIKSLNNKIRNLESCTTSLSNNVQRAENERQIKQREQNRKNSYSVK
ncbi:WXG100 family type VII secretion target [Ruminiclostridium herbifermentans]|uniref:WXG100 family type VII secretion target n=1 Tax=Ruminiclostridium herbifermentans TaxID=2488810 RepID=A0A4U7JGP5_9FIRM|nr:WXG100 family type VII secretion target [Ruminiclostridium herbifermentans]QNU67819.1 WXG100 family type VII secretion target [Ruminiclostridium herbifermentans]